MRHSCRRVRSTSRRSTSTTSWPSGSALSARSAPSSRAELLRRSTRVAASGSTRCPSPACAAVRAVVLEQQGQPLKAVDLPEPVPGPGQLLLEVQACGVCRTDLHLRDAEIEAGKLPVVLGHQIVATTQDGRRVGVPWLGYTDGEC